MIGLCGLSYAWYSRRAALPELDWSLGKGTLRVDGIRPGMTKTEAYTAMGETGGSMMEHVYSSADKRTFFIGEKVEEVASFDRIVLPDGTELRSGIPWFVWLRSGLSAFDPRKMASLLLVCR